METEQKEKSLDETKLKEKDVKEEKEKKCKHKEKIEALENEKIMLNDKILRLTAEMQNMRRRYEEEIAKAYKYDGEDLIKKILPVIDNFERAIKLDDANLGDDLSKFLEGFKMIYGNMLNILNSLEVVEIDCLNKSFNPNTMEAVLTHHEDGIEAGLVVDVMQKGYMYKDKVIRVAMVKVSE